MSDTHSVACSCLQYTLRLPGNRCCAGTRRSSRAPAKCSQASGAASLYSRQRQAARKVAADKSTATLYPPCTAADRLKGCLADTSTFACKNG